MKTKPELITAEYTASDDLIKWCIQMGITSITIERERLAFILWHQTKKVRRSNFDLAFTNWLKKSLAFDKKKEEVIKKGSQSFRDYKPAKVKVDKSTGRDQLNKIKRLL